MDGFLSANMLSAFVTHNLNYLFVQKKSVLRQQTLAGKSGGSIHNE
jgi:hypothetical protein